MINEYIKRNRNNSHIIKLTPLVTCADGTQLSVQASETSYCYPRTDSTPYTAVEVGYIIQDDKYIHPPEWAGHKDGEGDFPASTYAFVPVELVEEFINQHGGIAMA